MSSGQTLEVVFDKRQYCDPSLASCPTSTSLPPSLTLSTASSNGSTATSVAPQTSTTVSTQSPSAVVAAASSSTSNAGTIAGCVVGGVAFLVLVVLSILLYLRARKRRRTPPSSEFMNSLKAGALPILRLDSGAEYAPALAEKGGMYTHYPPTDPFPFTQNSYFASLTMQNVKFPDEMVAMTDTPSGRPSIEKSFHPQRFSSQKRASDSFIAQHRPSTSVGSGKELWGSETEIFFGGSSQSPPRADSVLLFAPRTSLDELPSHASYSSQSPTLLHHLRS